MPLATSDLNHPDWPDLFFATLLNARIRYAHELRRRAVVEIVLEDVGDLASSKTVAPDSQRAGLSQQALMQSNAT